VGVAVGIGEKDADVKLELLEELLEELIEELLEETPEEMLEEFLDGPLEAEDANALTLAGIKVPDTGSVVLPPTTRPAVPSDTTVPLIVAGGPPRLRVWPPMTTSNVPPKPTSP